MSDDERSERAVESSRRNEPDRPAHTRREFLGSSALVLGAAGLGGCAPIEDVADEPAEWSAAAALRADALRALGEAVLPTATLGEGGVRRVLAGFTEWVDGFEAAAERPHGYLYRGLAEIRYGPPHPGPRWNAQLEALEIEARRRHGGAFAEIDVGTRRRLIERQLEGDELDRMPSPAGARHVALGLVAWFYATPEATDLCYGRRIGRYECRGLDTVHEEPEPLDGEVA